MNPDPQVLLVTGASSGIGRATALRAAAAGDHLVLVARGEASLKEVAAECERAGAASTLVLPADVGDDDAVERCVEQAVERFGRLDAVVNAAGVVAYGRAEEVPVPVFDGVLRTNLLGSANLARHVLPVLRRQGRGTLLLVGSVVGHVNVPSMTPYVVSKWGIRSLARQLVLENRDVADVHIGYVAPGGVDTPIYQQAANYAGFAGRPPPPVSSADRAARQILDRIEHPWLRSQLTLANDVLRVTFSALPWLYDRIVEPVFPLVATDLTRPTDHTEGNVLTSQEDGNRVAGDSRPALAGLARNLVERVRGHRGPRE